jgi:hypothetical protein
MNFSALSRVIYDSHVLAGAKPTNIKVEPGSLPVL